MLSQYVDHNGEEGVVVGGGEEGVVVGGGVPLLWQKCLSYGRRGRGGRSSVCVSLLVLSQ